MRHVILDKRENTVKEKNRMLHTDGTDNDVAQDDSMKGQAGDVEAAGETTAADTITGPSATRPVGAETMVKVAGTPETKQPGRTTTEDLVHRQGEDSSDEPES
jgi:hypothetical protein